MIRSNVDHRMVQVNAAMRTNGTTSDFSVDYLTRDLDNVNRVSLIKATLPRMFTNISIYNNRINISHAGSTVTYIVTPGQYTAETLATALTAACAGIFTSFVYDNATARYIATYSSVTTATIETEGSTIAPYIGLIAPITLGAPSPLQAPPFLSGPDQVYVRSSLVAANSCVTAGTITSIPLIAVIDFTETPYGFTGRTKEPPLHVEFTNQVCMRKINVQICDVFGNLLVLPENCYLDMILQFGYS